VLIEGRLQVDGYKHNASEIDFGVPICDCLVDAKVSPNPMSCPERFPCSKALKDAGTVTVLLWALY